MASLVTPGQTIAYAPDAWGRPTQLGTWVTAIQYHPNGIPSGFTYGNGLIFSQSLDLRRRPQLQEVKNGAAWIQKLQYGYTNGGDVTAITDQVNGADSVTMTYDSLRRLKSASGLWGSYSYVYDPLNNIRSRSGPNEPLGSVIRTKMVGLFSKTKTYDVSSPHPFVVSESRDYHANYGAGALRPITDATAVVAGFPSTFRPESIQLMSQELRGFADTVNAPVFAVFGRTGARPLFMIHAGLDPEIVRE